MRQMNQHMIRVQDEGIRKFIIETWHEYDWYVGWFTAVHLPKHAWVVTQPEPDDGDDLVNLPLNWIPV